MVNKRGYSFGPEYPIHYERRLEGWAVFDARTDEDKATGLTEWDAFKIAHDLNGHPRADVGASAGNHQVRLTREAILGGRSCVDTLRAHGLDKERA